MIGGFFLPDLRLVLPESILVLAVLYIILEGVLRKEASSSAFRIHNHYGLLALIIAFGVLVFQHAPGDKWVSFEGQIFQNDYVFVAKALILLGSAAVFSISMPIMTRENLASYEYSSLILLATVGMLIMVGANDFLLLFIGLEIQGLSLYILAALNHSQLKVSEAALKYFVLGALATGIYVYGVSLVYGFAGTTNFDAIFSVVRSESVNGVSIGLVLGLIFIIASMAFKASAAPFHMWTPDVYQGCPTPITAFIAASPKVAAMLIFLRIMFEPFELLYGEWKMLIVLLSLVSMIVGSFGALRQTDLKRLLAYSAISQMGYALMGIAAGNEEGVQAVIVYLTLYLVMIIGTFGCLLCFRSKNFEGIQNIEDLKGISQLHPKVSLLLAIFMFSLSGIPPLAGFFAKFYVFKAAISAGLFGLAIVGVLTSVIGAFYYLRIVRVMYFEPVPDEQPLSYGQTVVWSTGLTITLNICAAISVLFFAYPSLLLDIAQRASFAIVR